MNGSESTALARMIHEMQRPECLCISFDIFDTLISRALEHPDDLFFYMNPRVFALSKGVVFDFHVARQEAEQRARNASPVGETTLDAIYDQLQDDLFITPELAEAVKKLEIAAELRFCRPRPAGHLLWQAARKSGKRIICISDMYLPEDVVASILRKAGYDGIEAVFLSCSYGVTKHSGKLYQKVLDSLKIPADAVVHIGDNILADIEMAQKHGLTSLHVPRSMDNAFRHVLYNPVVKSTTAKSHSLVKGLIADRLLDAPGAQDSPSLFQGSRINMGYACLGPMITGFALWLARAARAENVSRLYFLSREGWILQQAYDILNDYGKFDIPSTYLYASRRAVACAFLHSPEGIRQAIDMTPFFGGLDPGELMRVYFDVSPPASHSQYGQEQGEERKKHFVRLCMDNAEAILRQGKEERRNYLEYLTQAGLCRETKPGLVDSGGKGTSQWGLSALLNRPLSGYYFFCGDRMLQMTDLVGPVSSYNRNFAQTTPPDVPLLSQHVSLAETLMGHTELSLRRFARNADGSVFPVFYEALSLVDEQARRDFVREVQIGAISFVRDFAERLDGGVRHAHIDPEFSLEVFRTMVSGPPVPEDAALWANQFAESVRNGMRPFPLAYRNRRGKNELFRAPGTSCNAVLDACAADLAVTLEQWQPETFDPSMKNGFPSFPALRLPGVISRPEEYAAVGTAILTIARAQVEQVAGPEAFAALRNSPGYQDTVSSLTSFYARRVNERYSAYLAEKAEELAGREVYYFGCGAAYHHYKRLFSRSLPRCMLISMAVGDGNPKRVDGLPVLHAGKVLGNGERLPLVLFARAEHSGLMLDFLAREFPEYNGDLTVSCILFAGQETR